MINDDLMDFFQDKLSTYAINTGFNPVVYDEINYKPTLDDNEISVIFSGGAISRIDPNQPMYSESFVLNARCEKNGFDVCNTLLNTIFNYYNNYWTTLGNYKTKIVLQAPVMFTPYVETENSLTCTFVLRGTIYYYGYQVEIRPYHYIKIGSGVYETEFVLNPIIGMDEKGNEENQSGVGKLTQDYYLQTVKFALLLDNFNISQTFLRELAGEKSSYSFIETKEPMFEGSEIPVTTLPTSLSDLEYYIGIKIINEGSIFTRTGDGYALNYSVIINASGNITIPNGYKVYSIFGTLLTGSSFYFSSGNRIYCSDTTNHVWRILRSDFKGYTLIDGLMATSVIKATDTDSGVQTLNVVLQKKV